jgi:ribonucleoside-diphosphate reductase alpha chain
MSWSEEASSQGQANGASSTSPVSGGLTIERRFTSPGKDPLDDVAYESRRSVISNPDGSVVFAMEDLAVPSGWSQLATDIVVSKYFRKAGVPGTGSEMSVRQVIYRVAHTIREAGDRLGGFFATAADADAFEAELTEVLINQKGAFNSPVWFNVGLFQRYGIQGSGGNFFWNPSTGQIEETKGAYQNPQASACFIQAATDDLMGIYELVKSEARIFKYGSGTGTNFSKIRGAQEKLSGGGTSSGLMSFLEVFDRAAGATKSGGTTRRAAKMVCLDMDHPEIVDFIQWKTREEKKVAALIAGGYPSDFNGEAYKTVSGQNSNNSVRVSDEFMRAYEDDGSWQTRFRTTGEIAQSFKARDLMRQVSQAAWACADPGIQYDTTINDWHTCINTDRIFASNPCSEFMFLDDTACNLASVNLTKFLREDGSFDVEGYRHTCRILLIAQEILVDFSSYPTKRIAQNSHDYRPLGLGYANLGTLLMVLGLPYDSERARSWAGAITSLMCAEAYKTSAEIAKSKQPFPGFSKNREPMLRVISKHRDAAYRIPAQGVQSDLFHAARTTWDDALSLGKQHGYRNSQVTVLAPTGCLVAGTLVATDRGLVRLEGLGDPDGDKWQDVSFRVMTDQGPKQATKFFINGVDDVIEVATENGYRIRGTPKHRIKVVQADGSWVWRRFAELGEGDLVPMPLGSLFGAPVPVELPECELAYRNQASSRCVVPRQMNAELAELVGFFVGDGSLHERGLRLALCSADQDSIQRASALFSSLFGVEPYTSQEGEYTTVGVHSTRVARWWESCGFAKVSPSEEHSGKGYEPKIPDAILATNDPKIYGAFLRGLYETDGTVNLGMPSFSTKSQRFAQELAQVLLALGLPIAGLEVQRGGTSGQPVYRARLANAHYIPRWRELVGFVGARKNALLQNEFKQAGRHDHIPVTQALLDRVCPLGHDLRHSATTSVARTGALTRHMAQFLAAQSKDAELAQLLGFFFTQVTSAELVGREPTYDLSVPENVTYVANGFVSHNTIGLLMDCDTTGVEPDFSLVKFKKLAGGGYFKIVNESVPRALTALGYSEREISDIVAYARGTQSLEGAPHVNRATLLAKGLQDEDLAKVQRALPGAFDLEGSFAAWILGDATYQRLGISKEKSKEKGFSLLRHLGFTGAEILDASDVICGRMTVEGAPHLKAEHYAVFDCANRCGRIGKRFIEPMGHVRMMAAVQPFLSGAISKTVNVPNECSVEEIETLYVEGWRLGLKALAIYRDGSKLSQPLSTSSKEDKKEEKKAEKIEKVERPISVPAPTQAAPLAASTQPPALKRRRLPKKRYGFTQEVRINGQKVYIRTGEYEDGTLGEIFIDMHKEGAAFRSMMNAFAISVSLGLQYGVPLDEYVDVFTFTRFEPQGITDHPNIRTATSPLDFIFRVLGMEYLGRTDFVHTPPTTPSAAADEPVSATARKVPAAAIVAMQKPAEVTPIKKAVLAPLPAVSEAPKESNGAPRGSLSAQMSKLMGDAPFCDVCGHLTVRNGACYKCLNCGNSMGCS